MTSIFSEELADFISDTHERHKLPALMTGAFTDEQVADINEGLEDLDALDQEMDLTELDNMDAELQDFDW